MPRDREERPADHFDRETEAGERETRRGRSTVPGEDATEGDLPDRIAIAIVDEILEAERVQQTVQQGVQPSTTIEPLSTVEGGISVARLNAERIRHRVGEVVRPGNTVIDDSVARQITTVVGLQSEKTEHNGVTTVRPQSTIEEQQELTVSLVEELVAERITDNVGQVMSPQHQRKRGREPLELEEVDPVFGWQGGSPYGSGRPKLVIHRDIEGVPSLPFLHVLLRDTYKELVGSEPGADSVEFVASEPRIPQVQKKIVTLDLRGDGWTSSMREGKPVIERNSVDIIPSLQDVAATLYSGELGYFVVNIPNEWEDQIMQEEFFAKLVNRITGASPEEGDSDSSVFNQVKASPVVVADPRVSEAEELLSKVATYFGVDSGENAVERVEQVEEVQERGLRREDWKRVALTERQSVGDESDEHYCWKALIAEGLAWHLWQSHEAQTPSDKSTSFSDFFQEEIVPNDVISTEDTVKEGNNGERRVVADIRVSASGDWIQDGIESFTGLDDLGYRDLVFEFETGRSEGAFNFRKIRETLEKYSSNDLAGQTYICITIPPRLLFRGKNRARLLLNLVRNWEKEGTANDREANLFIPKIDTKGHCTELIPASTLIESLYEAGDDE